MLEKQFDQDAEGRADQFVDMMIQQAMSDLRKPSDEICTKPCKCGMRDARTQKGYALCEDCFVEAQL